MDEPDSVGPKLEFESALAHFVDRAQEMMSSQARMRDLIRINNELTSNLDLPNVLRRIVEIGKELLNARYAAMGVIGDERRSSSSSMSVWTQRCMSRSTTCPRARDCWAP